MNSFFSFWRCLWCTLCIAACLVACDDSERFTTDQGAVLSFSSDSIQFDTVITTVGSSTRMLKVYNRNDRGVRIARAWLEQGAASPFRVNIDGVYLSPSSEASVSGLELRGTDSLMAFAEVTVPERNQNEPFVLTDRLLFQLESGVVQSVVLEATGQDAYMWRGKVIRRGYDLAGRSSVCDLRQSGRGTWSTPDAGSRSAALFSRQGQSVGAW